MNLIKKYSEITIIVICVFIFGEHAIYSQKVIKNERLYSSKWDRVLSLGKEIKQGSIKNRLQTKDEILNILFKEEPNYPIVYVDQNAAGFGDGSSWYNAFHEIQPAIEFLENKEGEGWIWVAQGIYNPIIIKSGIMVFGGFSGKEKKLGERNYLTNETIIRNKNGPNPKGPSGVTMKHKTLIDGFTIRNCGYCNYDSKGKLADNFVGGGIRTWSWFSIIRNNHIYNNVAASGSGIAAWGRHDYQRMEEYAPIIERNTIYHNSSTCGAVVIYNSEVLFTNNIVCFNRCDIIPKKSKGIEIDINPTICNKPIIVNSIIWGNTKKKYFADLYNHVNKVENYGDKAKAISLYNCIEYKGYGEGLVKNNPLFIDSENNDYQLNKNSPCINAGYPEAPYDADSTRADIGIFILQYCLTIIDNSKVNPEIQQNFFPGTVVSLSADSLVVDSAGTTQYLFNSWIGYGSGSYTGFVRDTSVCMDTSITEIIDWNKKFWLEVTTGTAIDSNSGWYAENSSITLSLSSLIHSEPGKRKRFLAWQGIGEKAFTDKDTSITLTMRSSVELSVLWQNEYFLKLNSEYGLPVGENWYKEGDTAQFHIFSPVSGEEGIRHIFTHWQGTGEGSYTGTSLESSVLMFNSITETACWKTQYFLNLESDFGNPVGEEWYDEHTSVCISVDTVVTIKPETRMRFCGWSGNGYTGLNPAPLINVLEPIIQKAEWQKEYWVDIAVEPAEGGEVIPFGEPGVWLRADQSVTFSIIENIVDGYGFYSWQGDISSTDKLLSLRITEPLDLTAHFKKGSVIITTIPPGRKIIADGTEFTEPKVFFWKSEELHEIDVPDPQVYSHTSRYTFDKWNTGEVKKHTIVVTDDCQRISAYFNSEFYVYIKSDYAQETIRGQGWYKYGDTAVVSIDSITADSAATRYRFSKWTGTIESFNCHFEVGIYKPLFLEAEWIVQYFLEVMVVPPDSGYIVIFPSGNWFDFETKVKLEAFPRNNEIEFIKWSGSVSSSDNPAQFIINEPSTVWAHFNSQFNLGPEITEIPDTKIWEDSVFQIMIENYVTDPTDSLRDLLVCIENNTHFNIDFDRDEFILNFIPQLHWFGRDSIILKVSDRWQISDLDTFIVEVKPVDDPPGEFSLIYPEDDIVITDTTDYLEFSWENSVEVDGETVLYDLFLGTDSLFENGIMIEKKNITKSTVTLDISDLHSTVYWGVLTRDKNNETWCKRPFRLTSVFNDWNISFDSFALYQNCPNPFNTETQVTFYLPQSSKVKMKIFDTSGRLVTVIANDFYTRGVHAFSWKISDSDNGELSSGIYILQAHLGTKVMHKKMMVVK